MTRHPLISALVGALALFLSGIATPVQAQVSDAPALTFANKAEFGAAVRAYLLENPEVIMEAVAVLEQRQAQAQARSDAERVQAVLPVLHNLESAWETGNPDGDITLVEFMDYRCSYCRRAHDEVKELVESDGDIRLIIVEFPILGEASIISSQFAIAVLQVAGADAYEQVNDRLIRLRGNPDEATLRGLAADLGLDADEIMRRSQSAEVNAVIAANRDIADILDIRGTPTFVLNDQMLRGYLPLDAMRGAVAEARG